MSYQGFPLRTAEPETYLYVGRTVGGTTATTEVSNTASGFAISYVSSGRFRLTWSENPGLLVCAQATFQATTPADVKSYVAVWGAMDTSAFTLDVYLYESGTLTDLADLEWLNVAVWMKRGGVAG